MNCETTYMSVSPTIDYLSTVALVNFYAGLPNATNVALPVWSSTISDNLNLRKDMYED